MRSVQINTNAIELFEVNLSSYRELKAWQCSIDLAKKVYLLTKDFPKHEVYGLSSQIQRAAVSIPSNIAEGSVRESTPEFLVRFVHSK